MANPEHLKILKQGMDTWNFWRANNRDVLPDLISADLRNANLSMANLRKADLRKALLKRAKLTRANLYKANLEKACLISAELYDTNLRTTRLSDADFKDAKLYGANISYAELSNTNFKLAHLWDTVFVNTDLSYTKGLFQCKHGGPSIIDHRTLARSRNLPLEFLQGCGFSEWQIESVKLFNPNLTPSQIKSVQDKIFKLRCKIIQFYSCFISYSSKDKRFAKHLYDDLQAKGIRCWFAPEDMKIGAEIRDAIDDAIRSHDRVLLILSEHSIQSDWVKDEVESTFEKERANQKTMLFPISVDNAIFSSKNPWATKLLRQRNIGDFTRWKNPVAYNKALERLLLDLKTT